MVATKDTSVHQKGSEGAVQLCEMMILTQCNSRKLREKKIHDTKQRLSNVYVNKHTEILLRMPENLLHEQNLSACF